MSRKGNKSFGRLKVLLLFFVAALSLVVASHGTPAVNTNTLVWDSGVVRLVAYLDPIAMPAPQVSDVVSSLEEVFRRRNLRCNFHTQVTPLVVTGGFG